MLATSLKPKLEAGLAGSVGSINGAVDWCSDAGFGRFDDGFGLRDDDDEASLPALTTLRPF